MEAWQTLKRISDGYQSVIDSEEITITEKSIFIIRKETIDMAIKEVELNS